jgi:hypothetical protein
MKWLKKFSLERHLMLLEDFYKQAVEKKLNDKKRLP